MAFDKSNIGKKCYINLSQEAGIDDSSLGKIIGYYNESNEEYYFVSIIPDGKVIKVYDDSLINIIDDGSGGSVTPEAIVDATGQMDSTQKSQMLSDLNAQEKITASGILKGDGNGGVTAAVEGIDYGTYSKPSWGIPSIDFDSSTQAQLLPDVTNVDNGKFARVVNGAWAAVTVPEAAGGDF